jgi:hypothetical protein
MIFKAVRRKLKTGSYLPSEEELAAPRLRCGQPQSLWTCMMMASIMLLNAILQTDIALGRLHRHASISNSLVLACIWWGLSFFWIWRVFRAQQGAIPVEPDANSGKHAHGD